MSSYTLLKSASDFGVHPQFFRFGIAQDARFLNIELEMGLDRGWRFGTVTVQGADDWDKMPQAAIVKFKVEFHDWQVLPEAEIDPDWRQRLHAHIAKQTGIIL